MSTYGNHQERGSVQKVEIGQSFGNPKARSGEMHESLVSSLSHAVACNPGLIAAFPLVRRRPGETPIGLLEVRTGHQEWLVSADLALATCASLKSELRDGEPGSLSALADIFVIELNAHIARAQAHTLGCGHA